MNNKKNKNTAIFLDRDGVINEAINGLIKPEQFIVLPDVPEAVKKINDSGYLAILITNQPLLAKGFMTFGDMEMIHKKMKDILAENKARIDGIYMCPHHPEKGFVGEIPELKIVCDCRKPKPGLILKAAKDHSVDLHKSWFIGDTATDIEAGRAAGVKTVLVGDENFGQDMSAKSLLDAVEKILCEDE